MWTLGTAVGPESRRMVVLICGILGYDCHLGHSLSLAFAVASLTVCTVLVIERAFGSSKGNNDRDRLALPEGLRTTQVGKLHIRYLTHANVLSQTSSIRCSSLHSLILLSPGFYCLIMCPKLLYNFISEITVQYPLSSHSPNPAINLYFFTPYLRLLNFHKHPLGLNSLTARLSSAYSGSTHR